MDMHEQTANIPVLILAGGKGTRIQHLRPDVPKPFVVVHGRPFIEWIIEYFASYGFRNFVVSLGHLSEVGQALLEQHSIRDVEITSVVETEPLGTGGAIFHALREANFTSPFIVLNGDSVATVDLREAVHELNSSGTDAVMVGIPEQDATRYGTVIRDRGGYVKGFHEKRPGVGTINAGIYIFTDRFLQVIDHQVPSSLEIDILPMAIEQGVNVKLYAEDAQFIDIGTPDTLNKAEEFITRYMSGKGRMK